MGVFFVYILKASVCLALFYLCYRVGLSKETFHRFNRITLLSLMVFSFLLPLVEVTVKGVPELSQPFFSLEESMQAVVMESGNVPDETSVHFPWKALMLQVYVLGILFFLLRYGWSLGRMSCLLRTCRKEEWEGGITLYVHRKKVAPFSWMKMMVISEEDLAKNGMAILAHERAHIRSGHSWDLLLMQVCILLQWFNPAVWLLKQELQTVHEYEADKWVVGQGIDAKAYQLSIIESVVGTRLFTMANNFNHTLLNKRIRMMNKARSNRWAYMKCLFVLPMAALAVVAFARPPIDELKYSFLNEKGLLTTVEMKRKGYFTSSMKDSVLVVVDEQVKGYGQQALEDIPGEQIASILTIPSEATIKVATKKALVKEKIIFKIAEEMPEFPGGMKECMKFINKNTRYPAEAHRNGIHGRVVVDFLVTDEGDIKAPTISKSVDPVLDAEALRVIKMMPRWKPGKQRGKPVNVVFKLPVSFNLQ